VTARFKLNYSGVGEMLRSPEMQAEMLRRVKRMQAYAEATAPYDAADKDGDHYRDHFLVESGVQHHKTSRAYGRLTNDSDHAVQVEFGSKNNPAHHTMLRSIDAARD
jgi:hypothetical protein